jgi:ADP-Ribosyltransferase in polyvalent proteins
MFEEGQKYNGVIPQIKYLPTHAIEHSGMAGEVHHVDDSIARNMDFSKPVEATAFRYGRNHDEHEPSVQLSDGHHRLAAAKQTGRPHLPVIVNARNAMGRKLNALKAMSDEIERSLSTSNTEKSHGNPVRRAYQKGGKVEGSIWHEQDVIPHGHPQREENLAKWHEGAHHLLKDENNKPKVLYHGTSSDFSKFGKSITGEFGPGIYASDLPQEASDYAGTHSGNQNVMPIYMNLRNPFVPKHAHEFWDKFGGENDDEAMYNAMAAGHDGVIYQRPHVIYDPKTKDFVHTGHLSTHYIAFSPNQIKSATGNNGHFDPSNPDITKADGGPVEPAIHPARLLSGVHIREEDYGQPIFTGSRHG